MTRVPEVDEPLPVQEPRALFEEMDPSLVVLDEIIKHPRQMTGHDLHLIGGDPNPKSTKIFLSEFGLGSSGYGSIKWMVPKRYGKEIQIG